MHENGNGESPQQTKAMAIDQHHHYKQRLRNRLSLSPITLLCRPCITGAFLHYTSATKCAKSRRLSLHHVHYATVAVLGADLGGVTAAYCAATASHELENEYDGQHMVNQVWLLTSHDNILAGCPCDIHAAHPILPDVSLNNMQLIERYGNGGRELAGILAKQFTPSMAKEWLQKHIGIVVAEQASNTLSTLLKEKPLVVQSSDNQRSVQACFQAALDRANVTVLTSVNISSVTACHDGSFRVDLEGHQPILLERLVLAGDYYLEQPLILTKRKSDAIDTQISKILDMDDSPLSRKELAMLEKQRTKAVKKQKRKKESISAPIRMEQEAHRIIESEETTEEFLSNPPFNTLGIARQFGHRVEDEAPGLFTFLVSNRDILEGCTRRIVPKARLRCKLNAPPTTSKTVRRNKGIRRLPKLEGPLFLSQDEVSGPAAWRQSALIAHAFKDAGYSGTLHIHFAPEYGGVEEIEKKLAELSDPTAIVMQSCPLVHQEVDYEHYDVDTGTFASIVLPMVPDVIWGHFCRLSGVSSENLRWSELSSKTRLAIARLMVDCPLKITGICPQQCVIAGGVQLKEIHMPECRSQIAGGLFLCGSSLDIHGYDGGFHPLASLATGYIAGTHASKVSPRNLHPAA